MEVGWAVKAIIVIVISSVLLRCASATTNHSVGGPTGWDLASDLRAWAAATTFYAGDNLVFSYGPTHDVLEVNGADFARCRTTNPIKAYNDGETVVLLEEGGTTRYFFCGRSRHCDMGLKLEVEVLLSRPDNANGTTRPHTPSPPPYSSSSQSPEYPYDHPHHLPLSPPAVPIDDNHRHHEYSSTSGSDQGGRVSDPPIKLLIGINAIWLSVHARGRRFFFLRCTCWLHVVASVLAVIVIVFF
ncbi:uclacyanin 1-like [Rhododendron vialii]|uniref:uclacyanin 1-like n=1 Tax=Rhododendron vialii TaxID=182163 RepID=UPI00265F4111|nr:uclacyanin 1-like [Rhododendron vialii]XP_058195186.1 uclacyanin 1-like [Rhododendron vialii]XP_058195187.1 uclacyanin 1-like [Rhododendron vialii]